MPLLCKKRSVASAVALLAVAHDVYSRRRCFETFVAVLKKSEWIHPCLQKECKDPFAKLFASVLRPTAMMLVQISHGHGPRLLYRDVYC